MPDSQEPGIKQSECSCVIDRAIKEGLISTCYDQLVKTEARGGNTAMRTETEKKYNWVEW